jgi:hypothetical protein
MKFPSKILKVGGKISVSMHGGRILMPSIAFRCEFTIRQNPLWLAHAAMSKLAATPVGILSSSQPEVGHVPNHVQERASSMSMHIV